MRKLPAKETGSFPKKITISLSCIKKYVYLHVLSHVQNIKTKIKYIQTIY